LPLQYSSSDEDTPRFGELGDALGRAFNCRSMVGMHLAQALSITALHIFWRRRRRCSWESETTQCPLHRISNGTTRTKDSTAKATQRCNQFGTNWSSPSNGSTNDRHDRSSQRRCERRGSVDRSEDLLLWCTPVIELEREYIAISDESMRNSVKPNSVDLQPKSKARLRDTPPSFELVGERLDVGNQLFVYLSDKSGDNSAKQHPSKARGRFARQMALA